MRSNFAKLQITCVTAGLLLNLLWPADLLLAQQPTQGAIRHVLLISVDGLHAVDLAKFIKSEPDSALARLSATGVTYTQASIAKPSNSFTGLLSILTGGSPISTGVWYEGSYSRSLSPPGSNCATRGTLVVWGGTVDRDRKAVDGGGIDPAKLPLDPSKGCTPVFPHNFLRVNTIFEVAHDAGLRTAWSDKHPSYEMVSGPSGKGVDDLFTPEIGATTASRNLQAAEVYDDIKVQGILNLIAGKDHTGVRSEATPALFGVALQYVSFGQKLPTGGYVDAVGTPSAALANALKHTDESIGKLVEALKAKGLAESTLIIVTAKHGESPIDVTKRRIIADSILPKIIKQSHGDVLALAYQDGDLASIWLKDQRQTSQVTKTLSKPENQEALDIQQILSGESLKLMFDDPLQDERIPDIVLIPNLGGIYTEEGSVFIAEHGGFNDDDTNVALLIANPRLPARVIRAPVQTTQIAPSILKALGLNPNELQAVRKEGTILLPNLLESLETIEKIPQPPIRKGPETLPEGHR